MLEETTTVRRPPASLPRILPLEDAAREMGISPDTLADLVQSGQIPAYLAQDGQTMVPVPPTTTNGPQPPSPRHEDDLNARLARIRREDFKHLEGIPITVSEAAKKYGVSPYTIHTWKRRYPKAIRVLKPGKGRQGSLLNEADIAYLAAIHHIRKAYGTRAPLLNEDGSPYLIKYPDLAKARRVSTVQS